VLYKYLIVIVIVIGHTGLPQQCNDDRPSGNAAVQRVQASCQHAGCQQSDQTHSKLSVVNSSMHFVVPQPCNTR